MGSDSSVGHANIQSISERQSLGTVLWAEGYINISYQMITAFHFARSELKKL
jgi:hypothetical protein